MGVFSRLRSAVPPSPTGTAVHKVVGRLPNSFDAESDDPARLVKAARRIENRHMDELIGMCRMVLADGAVDDPEARFLLSWIQANIYAADKWPGSLLYERIAKAMLDDQIDQDEERELLEVIHQVAGGAPSSNGPPTSGAIPFDNPVPPILHEGRCFVLTGQFVYGSRTTVTEEIQGRGGMVKEACSRKVSYLIVGTVGSEEWLHSTHGTKIIRAVELKQEGKPLAIVSEQNWVASLGTQ